MPWLDWILARLREPSTLAGLAALLQSVSLVMAAPGDPQAWGTTVAAVLAMVLKEGGNGDGKG